MRDSIGEPDLWAISGEQRKRVESATAAGSPNTPFTEEEQLLISARLDEIKEEITAGHPLQGAQVKLLTEQIDFLKEQSKSQGRRSWMQMALGAVLTCYLGKIDPAVVQAFLARIVETFTPLVTNLLLGG